MPFSFVIHNLEFGSHLTTANSISSDIVISFQESVKNYNKRKTIGPINIEVRKSEVVGFLGPNGSGKTTCIRLMLGLMRPSSGKILVNGG